MTTVDELHARGVGLCVLADTGAEIDTMTANGRLVFGIFASLVEFGRELIARTHPRRLGGRPRGPLGGRPRKVDVAMLRMAMRAMADRHTKAHDLAQCLGITTTTLYMYVNGDVTVKEPGRSYSTRPRAHDQEERHACTDGGVNLLSPCHAGRPALYRRIARACTAASRLTVAIQSRLEMAPTRRGQ